MYLSGLGIYYLKNGQPVDTLYVGDQMTFNVPGYSKIWLDQYQNGQLQYSGPFDLPMPPYTLLPRDVGSFTASIFELKPNGTKGDNIGTDRVTVLAAPASQVQTQTIYAPPTVVGQGAPAYSNVAAGGSGAGTALVSTGVPTPSAPPPNIIMQPPSGPIDLSTPFTPGGLQEAPAPQEAGFSGLGIALILGVAVFAFSRGGKK